MPAAEKSGNLHAEELRRRALPFLNRDRDGLVEAICACLASNDDLVAAQAAVLVRELQLREASKRVRDEAASGSFMKPSSVWLFDRTLESLE